MNKLKATVRGLALSLTVGLSAGALAEMSDYDYAASTYTVGSGEATDFVPAEDNLLRLPGTRCQFGVNSQLGKESSATDCAVLCDGQIVDDSGYKANVCTFGDNTVLEWTLPAGMPYQVEEVRIYSLWGNNNRNDISVKSIEVKGVDNVWTVVDGSTFCSSQEKNNFDPNTIGDPLVTTHRKVTFASRLGPLAYGVVALRINFGKQDNGYGGFAEIEAIGRVARQTLGLATVTGLCSYDREDDTDVFKFSSGRAVIEFSANCACTRTEGGTSYAFTALAGEAYDIVPLGEDPVVLRATIAGDVSAPSPRVTGFEGTIDGETASAELAISLPFAGADGAAATLEADWWRMGETQKTTVVLDGTFSAGATPKLTLTGLTPGLKYCVQVRATANGLVGSSDVFVIKVRDSAPLTIISSVGAGGGVWKAIEDTQLGLTVNLPFGSWICGGGWDWSQPEIAGDHFSAGEEHACAALPLASHGDYDRPARLTISGEIAHSQGGGGLGFWNVVPLRSKEYVVENTFDEEGGTNIVRTEKRYYDSRTGYTGLIFTPTRKTLQVYAGGKLQGSPVTVEVTGDNDYHTLKYTIDTSTGALEYVLLNGRLVLGLTSDAFTEVNTAYAGFMTDGGGRTDCKNFEVTEGQEMPVDPVLTIGEKNSTVFVGDKVSVPVSALNPVTMEPVPVLLESFDGEGASVVDGAFVWTASEPGVYTFEVSATIGASTIRDSGLIRVYAQAPAAPADYKPIFRAVPDGSGDGLKFAGSLQTNATDCTSHGLEVNQPGALWTWDSGFDWAPPRITDNGLNFNLSEEQSTVHLAITNTTTFVKPRELYVQAACTFTGRGCVGFWSQRNNVAGERNALHYFSGLVFNKPKNVLQAYSDGNPVGEPAWIEFPEGRNQSTLRFAVDLKNHRVTDVVFNEFLVGDFDIPGLADETTPLFGIGSLGNADGYAARLQFQLLELSGRPRPGFTVFVR